MKNIVSSLLSRLCRQSVRKMEITRTNFKERLPSVEAAIDDAIFLSIDGEFTGLSDYKRISAFDLPHERYDKLQASARQFLLVQFGLCAFHYDAKLDKYSNQAFNFYVWPRPYSRQAPDPRFLCQTSSIDFLSQQGFDFNKLFKDGVSYLRPAEMEKLKDSLVARQEYRRNSLTPGQDKRDSIAIPSDQNDYLNNVHKKIRDFLASDDASLELPKGNGFQRRLIYQTVKDTFSNVSLQSINKDNGDRLIVAIKADEEKQEKLAALKDEAELTDLVDAFGFSRVIQKITESKKMVVGHNMVLDIAHTLNQFCGPLPDNYNDFKAMTQEVFPIILDTKLMANTIPFKDEITKSTLEGMMETLSKMPYELPEAVPKYSGGGYHLDSNKYHEAGYDAFITGLCFIAMSNRLGSLCGTKNERVLPESNLIKPFINKLYLMRVADIPYMNLSGEDIQPDRSHVFHIQFPGEWKRSDLDLLFSPFGKVFVSWIDDTSAFVSVPDQPDPASILTQLQSSTTYKIQSYKKYQELKEAAKSQDFNNSSLRVSSIHLPPSSLDVSSDRPSLTRCGITPNMAKSTLTWDNNGVDVKKRSVSPPNLKVKRAKSVTEEKTSDKKEGSEQKLFDEPSWN